MFIRASGRFGHSLFRLFIHLPRSVQQSLPLLLGQHRQMSVVSLDQCVTVAGSAEDQAAFAAGLDQCRLFAVPIPFGKFNVAADLVLTAIRHMVSPGLRLFDDQPRQQVDGNGVFPFGIEFAVIVEINDFKIAGHLAADKALCFARLGKPAPDFLLGRQPRLELVPLRQTGPFLCLVRGQNRQTRHEIGFCFFP